MRGFGECIVLNDLLHHIASCDNCQVFTMVIKISDEADRMKNGRQSESVEIEQQLSNRIHTSAFKLNPN